MKTLLVCGGRDFDNVALLTKALDYAKQELEFDRLICGYDPEDPRFQGADQLAFEWRKPGLCEADTFPADWDNEGRAAGPIRNSLMARERPDYTIAFPRKSGDMGAGTQDMLRKASAKSSKVYVINNFEDIAKIIRVPE